jgi:ferredoxin
VELNKDRWRMSRKDGKSTLIGSMLQHEIYRVDIHDDDEYNLHMKTAMNCPMKIIKVELVR